MEISRWPNFNYAYKRFPLTRGYRKLGCGIYQGSSGINITALSAYDNPRSEA